MKPLSKPANLEELRNRIAMLGVLDENTRRILTSNIKRFTEIVGRSGQLIICDVAEVRRLMASATPAAYGVSVVNWTQIRCGVWRCFELAGFKVLRGTGIELTDELASLLQNVPKHPDQTELTPLLKFLIAHNLSAWDLRQSHVPTLRDWLKDQYTRVNWSRAMKKSLARWAKWQSINLESWPQTSLAPEYVNRDWAHPWSSMTKLEAAVNAHLVELRQPRKRRLGGFRRTMKESTIVARKRYLRRLASAIRLATKVVPETLEDLTDTDYVERAVDYMMDKLGTEKSANVYQMLRHVNAIARHHVKRPAHELEELTKIRTSVAPIKGPAEKNRKLIEKFRNEALRDRFIEAPSNVLHRLRRKQSLSRMDLIEGMLAFLAAFLTKHPMRISEAMALKFGETIHDYGSGRNRQVIIDVHDDLTKTGVPRHAKLGPKLVALLDLYREMIHKHVAPSGNPHLFPSSGTGPRSADHISRQLAAWTTRHVVRMTAHQWRHVVGYIYLLENPGCYDTVRRLLGHRSVTTTIEYYAFVLVDDANESLDKTIDRLSAAAAKKLRCTRRRR